MNLKKKNRGREQAQSALELYKATLGAQMKAQSTTTTANGFQYWPLAEPKPKLFANLTPDAERLVKQILAGLARQNGGSLVLTESELGTEEDQIILDVNEKAGLVTITIIPDYVQIGNEEPKATVPDAPDYVLDPSQWSQRHIISTGNAVAYFQDGKPLSSGMVTTTGWNGTLTFDEVK